MSESAPAEPKECRIAIVRVSKDVLSRCLRLPEGAQITDAFIDLRGWATFDHKSVCLMIRDKRLKPVPEGNIPPEVQLVWEDGKETKYWEQP